MLRQRTVAYNDQLSRRTLAKPIDTVHTTMLKAPGMELAVPQIGLGLTLIAVEDHIHDDEDDPCETAGFPLHMIISPSYRPINDKTASFCEGCLSFDRYQAVRKRWLGTIAEWDGEDGGHHSKPLHGRPACTSQYETNHLSGGLYIDYAETRPLITNENFEGYWCDDPVPTEVVEKFGFIL